MIDEENIDSTFLEQFGIFGQSYILAKKKPSLEELIRYCIPKEKMLKRLLRQFEKNTTKMEFKKFRERYYNKSLKKLFENYLHINHMEGSLGACNGQIMYTSDRRKWVSMAENTELREYQNECVETIKINFYSEKSESTLLVLPTGAGKTKTVVHSIRDILDAESDKVLNILWLVSKVELCLQAEQAIYESWTEPRDLFVKKNIWLNLVTDYGMKPKKSMFGETHSFTISTPDSIERGDWSQDQLGDIFDIIVIDEAHHGISEQERIFDIWPDAYRIGITATPSLNKNMKKFNEYYKDLAYPENFLKYNGEKTNWKDTKDILIKMGYLSDYGKVIEKHLIHEVDEFNLDFKNRVRWDKQASLVLVAEKLSRKMIEGGCNRILLFVNKVDQARIMEGFLRDSGIRTSAVYGKLSQDERNSRLNGFSSGHFQVLISVDILREGIDIPLVDGILIMRSNLSQEDPMFTQMMGRGLRGPASKGTKKCTVWHAV